MQSALSFIEMIYFRYKVHVMLCWDDKFPPSPIILPLSRNECSARTVPYLHTHRGFIPENDGFNRTTRPTRIWEVVFQLFGETLAVTAFWMPSAFVIIRVHII